MADANTEVDIGALHTQIQQQIAAAFPAFKTVEFYRDDETEAIPAPAILLEMDDVEPRPHEDAGTGQLPVHLRFCARIIMGIRTPQHHLAVRLAATALAAWLYQRSWGNGINAQACEVISCMPDEFDPRLDKFIVWRVEWFNYAMLGTSAWDPDGTVIGDPWYSWAPDIGIPHEQDYIQLDPPPPT